MECAWLKSNIKDVSFLSVFENFLGDEIELFVKKGFESTKINRVQQDGLFTFIAYVEGAKVGVICSDFRVFGGSFGIENSQRAVQFLDYLESHQIPCVFFIDAIGVRFMEGRTVLKYAFGVLPRLATFAEKELLITVSKGNTLGIVAFYYRQGHYRLALKHKSQINLTGPEVIRLFFGQNYDFKNFSSADRQLQTRRMVQEILPDIKNVLSRVKNLLLIRNRLPLPKEYYVPRQDEKLRSYIKPLRKPFLLEDILGNLGEAYEVYEEMDSVLRSFVVYRKGRYFGLVANNLAHSNNMVGPHGFSKFTDSFKLFEKLRLPVMTIIDTPGGDPRHAGDNVCIIEEMTEAMLSIWNYPYKKLGVVAGRSFGGASLLGMPKAAGGDRVLILEGSNIGIMHKSILRDILKKSPNILEQWEQASLSEDEKLEDLLGNQSVDRIISREELPQEVDEFLLTISKTSKSELADQNTDEILLRKLAM